MRHRCDLHPTLRNTPTCEVKQPVQAVRSRVGIPMHHLHKMEGRLHQSVVVLKKLRDDLGLPYECEEVQAVKARLDDFIRTGEPWSGRILFASWDRMAELELTRKGKVKLTLVAKK